VQQIHIVQINPNLNTFKTFVQILILRVEYLNLAYHKTEVPEKSGDSRAKVSRAQSLPIKLKKSLLINASIFL
jgi:hypothetical protein